MATEDGIDYSEAPNLTGRSLFGAMKGNMDAVAQAQAARQDAEANALGVQVGQVELGPEIPDGQVVDPVTGEVAGEVAGEVEVQAAGQVPGQVVAGNNPYLDKAEQALEAGAAKERAGIEAQAEVDASKSRQKSEAMVKAEREASDYSLAQKRIAEKMEQMDRDFEQRNAADEAEVRRAYEQYLDPTRFWSNKDKGQKAMVVLMAGIYGYLGKGMDYLTRLDGLVSEDMKQQDRERSMRISMAEKIQAMHGQNYKTLREARERSYEDSLRAENKVWLGLKHTLEAIDVSHAGQAAVAQKDVALSRIDQRMAKGYMELAQIHDKEKTAEENRELRAIERQQNLELKREALGLKKQKAEEGEKLTPIMQTSIDHKVKYLQTLKNMREKISTAGEGGGVVGTLKQGWNAASSLAGDTKVARDLYNGLRHTATQARAQSALQQHEIAYFQGDFPDYETFLSSGPKQLDEIIAIESKNLQDYVNLQQSRGYNARTDAFKQFIGSAPVTQTIKFEGED